jgi:hypothetical protein
MLSYQFFSMGKVKEKFNYIAKYAIWKENEIYSN